MRYLRSRRKETGSIFILTLTVYRLDKMKNIRNPQWEEHDRFFYFKKRSTADLKREELLKNAELVRFEQRSLDPDRRLSFHVGEIFEQKLI